MISAPLSQQPVYDFTEVLPYLNRLDGVIWDLDGTLIINNEVYALDQIGDIFKKFLKTKHDITDNDCYRPYAGMPLNMIRMTVESIHDVSIPPSIETDVFNARKLSPLPHEDVKVHPFIQGLIELFHEHGIPQRIATGSEIDRALRYVHTGNLTRFFTTEEKMKQALIDIQDDAKLEHFTKQGIDGWLFHSKKPENSSYEMAIASMGDVDRSRILSLEDSVSGASAGHKSNVHVLAHQMAEHLPTKHEERVNHHINLMAAGAAAVIRREDFAVHAVKCILDQIFMPRPLRVVPRAAATAQKILAAG